MPKFEKNAAVVVGKPTTGVVQEIKFNENTGEPRYLVLFGGADGEEHHRWFAESDLSSTEPASDKG